MELRELKNSMELLSPGEPVRYRVSVAFSDEVIMTLIYAGFTVEYASRPNCGTIEISVIW